MSLPALFRIRQNYDRDPEITDLESEVRDQVEASGIRASLQPGARVAITGGSRGISNIGPILRAIGESLREMGASPFVITAMGSHGGATEEGQLNVLAELGVTESKVGMPVKSTMATRHVGHTPQGWPVYMDELALGCDGVFVVNRVKKHTDFHGEIESGLCKMLVIGLGKVSQADAVHANRPDGFPGAIEDAARTMIQSGKVLGGLAIVENRRGRTALLRGLPAKQIPEAEKQILRESYGLSPGLPFDEADLLIVRQLGKNISGTGMDTNVIGRTYIEGVAEPTRPLIQLIGVLQLTPESEGNAVGIGLADFATRRLVDKIDSPKTSINTVTSNFVRRGKTPITIDSDLELIETALGCVQGPFRGNPRVGLIEDTLNLEALLVSRPLLDSLNTSDVQVEGEVPLAFGPAGDLIWPSRPD